jgi:hypothetical protein
MTALTRGIGAAVARAYDFSTVKHLVDVGGSHGVLLSAVLDTFPNVHATLFDLPHVIDEAKAELARGPHRDRISTVAGSFFEPLPKADAYIMKSIIHDWDDDRCVTILENCRRAMAGGGRVLIIEPVVPAKVEPSFAMLGTIMSDLNMLLCTGGKERTEAGFAEILGAAGLRLTTVVPTPPPSVYSVIAAEEN